MSSISIGAGLPNITGSVGGAYNYVFNSGKGAFISRSFGYTNTVDISGKDNINNGTTLDASLSSSIYGSSETVTPESITTTFCIRY